jgi:hypothetical protein
MHKWLVAMLLLLIPATAVSANVERSIDPLWRIDTHG